ncbi:MAG: ech hydrogenase subunit, partial [Methanosarcina sp.]|nr:ech hydrogenase subunit [Methanosarcina sp.]
MLENEVEIKSSAELLKTVEGLKSDGYRYATMICLKANEGHDLIYIFEKDYKLKNLRYYVKPG